MISSLVLTLEQQVAAMHAGCQPPWGKKKKQRKYTYCDLGGTWFCLGANPQPNNTWFP